ncbi:PfkB family carbohydrate kinase [Evansella tamaricis]|uniref:PfkB family carbohydrate kinase n=1 Tax=Evansella tamaricis TaxID=2069301 RepID=UPI0024847527|nr:PfkB family carbohydrate kinase [Evansella tamaricis]
MFPALKVDVVDTTGAGDAFVSGVLYQLSKQERSFTDLSFDEMKELLEFAAISGGLATTKKGAMTALPAIDDIHRVREECRDGNRR